MKHPPNILTHTQDWIDYLRRKQSALADKPEHIVDAKRRQRMHTWWNAWFTGQEWRRLNPISAQPIEISDLEPAHLSLTLDALDYAIH